MYVHEPSLKQIALNHWPNGVGYSDYDPDQEIKFQAGV